MRTITPILVLLLIPSLLFAAEPKVHRGLPYAKPKNKRQTLDVYAPAKGNKLPVVVWIHGGGWRKGNKSSVQRKPRAFVEKGFVFVSTNYRFVPNVTIKEMTGDIAKAIRWSHDHAKEYGGDPNTIFVMGHSAGAHLAALVCTDEKYLKAEGLSLSIITGCVPVDVGVYDIPKRIKASNAAVTASLKKTFGETEASQMDLSPVTHVAKGKNIPPFLILHVADRQVSKIQSQWFADKLKESGISAKVIAAEGKTHGTINSELGLPNDKPTQALFGFLGGVLKRSSQEQIDKLKKLGARIKLDDKRRAIRVGLGERRVTDTDLVYLKGLQHLEELDLTRTRVTSAGLVNLKDLTTLKKLFLTDTKVDDSGIMNLKGMKSLELLGLSGTKISDSALDHLQELTELKSLFCLGTGVTDAGVAKLQKALPKCQIAY